MFRRGEVDLGVRNRANPDGAVVSFGGQSGGTGSELLLDGTIEPDFDGDLLGDETQDPDGGGAGFEDRNSIRCSTISARKSSTRRRTTPGRGHSAAGACAC